MAKEIRNFCILSHVDHGKTTLSDHLISLGGLLPDHLAGNLRALDFLPAEQSRGITIDTSIATFSYAIENKKVEVYLLDTPGHVDFGLKTREAMTLVDNGLIIVDAVEGVMSQTRSVLRDALAVGLNLVLYINKVDRLVKEMGMGIEQIRARIELIIGEIGYLCQTFGYLGEVPSFANGRVIVGSATDGWAYDSVVASTHGPMTAVINLYPEWNVARIPESARLSEVFKRVIRDQFLDAQDIKVARLRDLGDLRPSLITIITGQHFRMGRKMTIGSLVRVISGVLQAESVLFSHIDSKEVKIQSIVQFRGKKQIPVEFAEEGQIVGISGTLNLSPADILSSVRQNVKLPPPIRRDQVVRVSVEPHEIEELDNLRILMENLATLNPGISFTESPSTGELMLAGLGTLQIELILEDIETAGYEVQTSDPVEIFSLRVLSEHSFEKRGIILRIQPPRSVYLGGSSQSRLVAHDESEENSQFLQGLEDGMSQGLKEIFPQNYELTGVEIVCESRMTSEEGYEEGLVVANQAIRHWSNLRMFNLFRPYYAFNVQSRPQDIGIIVNTIQQQGGEILNIDPEGIIEAEIRVLTSNSLSDKLRQVTDGYVTWSFEGIVYKKI